MQICLKSGLSLFVLESSAWANFNWVYFNSFKPNAPAFKNLSYGLEHRISHFWAIIKDIVNGGYWNGLPYHALAKIGNVLVAFARHIPVIFERAVSSSINWVDSKSFDLNSLVLFGYVIGRELNFVNFTGECNNIIPGHEVTLDPDSSLNKFPVSYDEHPFVRSGLLPQFKTDLV